MLRSTLEVKKHES